MPNRAIKFHSFVEDEIEVDPPPPQLEEKHNYAYDGTAGEAQPTYA